MRTKLSNPHLILLTYGIREVVDVMQRLGELDPSVTFVRESIGDPIAKGWEAPPFLKQLIREQLDARSRPCASR